MKKYSSIFSTAIITPAISTTLVLLLLGTNVFFVLMARNLSDYVRENINLSVLISDELVKEEIGALRNDIRKAPYVKTIHYVSKETALKEATRTMGTDPTEFLGYNPFTASFEINIVANYANAKSMDEIVKEIKDRPAVVDVIYQRDLIESVNQNIQKLSIILLVIAALFLYISFALINNTVRLSIFSKRFLINTMKLVGAKWSFIRRPFMVNGATLGLLSAAVADALLYAGYIWLEKYEPEISLVVDQKVLITVGCSVLVAGLLITTLCTFVSLQKYLKMSTKKLYHI
jgi:cell division transport system permease protein